MTAMQNNPQASGSGSGSGDSEAKIRKFEAVIILLLGVIGGGFAGVVRRTMDHASYYGAISTGVVAAVVLSGFIFGVMRYIRGQA